MMSTSFPPQLNEQTPTQTPTIIHGLEGFIPCRAITDEDKNIEIAAIAHMLQKDLILLKKACHELASTAADKHFTQIELISGALNSLQLYSADILKLTNKKEYTTYAASRQTSHEKYLEKKKVQIAKQINNESMPIKKDRSIFDCVHDIAIIPVLMKVTMVVQRQILKLMKRDFMIDLPNLRQDVRLRV